MKKYRFFIPFALIGLIITGCANASDLVDNFSDLDREIETPWEEYVMPASALEFAEGEESIELNKGETHTYSYTIQPRGATVNSISWFSNDQNIATVENGVVTAVGGGETTILASSADANFDPVELAVKVNVPLVDFSLDVPARLDWNERYEFDVEYSPEDTTYRELNYEIVNPSVEGVATLDGDAVTTGSVNGTATLRVSAGSISHDYPLNIETIPVTGIVLSGADEVEVGHGIQVSATVSPSDASEFVKKGVKFYSRETDIATVEESTGVVTGVKAGVAHIYARVGDFESVNDLVVEVYEVHATSVVINTPAFTLANHGENGLEKQLEWTITTDKTGVDQPSKATITFASDNEEVAVVSNSGLVTATGPGTANISINIEQEGLAVVTASVAVTVNIVSTALTITGGTSFYNDESLTLTANLVPAKVSNEEITWSVEPATGVVVLSATTGKSVTLTPDNEDATGTVVVTATNTNGASNSVTINLAERTAEFTTGHHYIVGNHLFNSGESVIHATKTSWDNAKYAYHFTNRINNTGSLEEYKGTIHFQAGDQFRYRVGGYGEDGKGWVPAWEQHEGWTDKGYHIEIGGALADGSMKFVKEDDNHDIIDSDAADANIYVNTTGWYDLYAKLYKKIDGSTWYQLYICKVPEISTSLPHVTMGLDSDPYQIEPHDYIGEVTYTLVDGGEFIELSATGLITVIAAGVAHIKVSDSRPSETVVTVTVSASAHGVSKMVYLNANGTFDADGAHPFIYAWKGAGENVQDMNAPMELVAGQTIIYSAEIPADYNNIIFVRNESATTLDWKLGQTKDLILPEDGKDMFKPTSYETKIDGEWSMFDSSITYVADAQPPYIQYKVGAGDWEFLPLVNDNDEQYKRENIEFAANTEFVLNLGSTYGWRHYENLNTTYSNAADCFEAGEATGTNPTDPHNFKVLTAGTYNLYVKKNASADGGLNVFINHVGGGGGGDPTPEPPYVKYQSGSNWAYEQLVSGTGEHTDQWEGQVELAADAEFVICAGTGDWRHWSNFNSTYSTDKIVQGTSDAQNFKASEAGTYNFYVKKDAAADGGLNVYIQVDGGAVTTYTVSFNSNGGSGDMADATGISGTYTLPACTFTAPEGQHFVGWALTADGAVITEATITVTALSFRNSHQVHVLPYRVARHPCSIAWNGSG